MTNVPSGPGSAKAANPWWIEKHVEVHSYTLNTEIKAGGVLKKAFNPADGRRLLIHLRLFYLTGLSWSQRKRILSDLLDRFLGGEVGLRFKRIVMKPWNDVDVTFFSAKERYSSDPVFHYCNILKKRKQ